MLQFILAALLVVVCAANAEALPFNGSWSIDLRSAQERAEGRDCGNARFELTQVGDRISGSHSMSTVGCGRVNEGGTGSVKGVVVRGVAVLIVTSCRNGAVVLGTATIRNGALHWMYREEVQQTDSEGDSPLILNTAVLSREKDRGSSKLSPKTCGLTGRSSGLVPAYCN
jgi:hypothetical protein